jgi:folate-binding protein YgfZ
VTKTIGAVSADYLALRNRAGIVEGAHDVVWAEGEDVIEFLDGLLSQNVEAIPVGGAAPSLLLAPQGKLRATLWLLRGERRVGLIADRGLGDVVEFDLNRFKLRVDVTLTAETRAVSAVWGPSSGAALEQAGLEVPPGSSWRASGDVVVADIAFSRGQLPRFVVVGADAAALATTGLSAADPLASSALRVELGEPIMGIDIDERTIPQEAGIVSASVDFTKGCYLGQELVARIESRGRVNRHLRGVEIVGTSLPPIGSEVIAGDRVVGILSSVAQSPAYDGPVALALLRREVGPGDDVAIRWEDDSVVGRVVELPINGAG